MNSKLAKCAAFIALAVMPLLSGYSQTTSPAPTAPALSPAASEVVKLAESGTSDEVMLGYIQNSQSPYNLTADDVVYLKDIGISSQVITAMLDHDKSPAGQPYVYNQQLYPPSGNPAPPAQVPDQPIAPPPADVPPPAPAPVPEPVPAPATAEVSTTAPPAEVNYFYSDLSPYGSWVDLEGYGWCWQPSVVVVNRGWRPYCDAGHWVYTDAGWFWASDYSWGWAPFHYGRWHLHPRCGWVWFPDTVWAPSWVVWRSYGDGCGWAPLPRGAVFVNGGFRYNGVAVSAGFDFGLGVGLFTFVGFNNFTSHDLVHARYAPAECERVFHQTTIIHTYTVNDNHLVVNHGIPVDHISTATHSQIHAVAIHDLPPGAGKPVTRGGAGAVVYHHELGAPVHSTTPFVAQRVNDNNPVIRHNAPATLPNAGHSLASDYKATPSTYTPAHTAPQGQYTAPQSHNQPAYSPGAHQASGSSPPVYRPGEAPHTTATTTATSSPSPHNEASHSNSARQSTEPQGAAPVQQNNNHVYYPKGYYQAASVHMLPQENRNGVIVHPSSPSSPSGGSYNQSSQGQSQGHSQSQSQGQSPGQSKQNPK